MANQRGVESWKGKCFSIKQFWILISNRNAFEISHAFRFKVNGKGLKSYQWFISPFVSLSREIELLYLSHPIHRLLPLTQLVVLRWSHVRGFKLGVIDGNYSRCVCVGVCLALILVMTLISNTRRSRRMFNNSRVASHLLGSARSPNKNLPLNCPTCNLWGTLTK